MSWSVRDFDFDKDVEATCALITSCVSSPVTVDQFRSYAKNWPKGQPVKRLTAECDGDFAGYMRIGQSDPNPKNAFMISLFVEQKFRKQGIGQKLLDHAIQFAEQFSANAIVTMTMQNDTDGVSFGCNRGYTVVANLFDSYLDLPTFKLSNHERAIPNVEQAGYRVASLADFDLNDETKRALYASVVRPTDLDSPGIEYFGVEDYEQFHAETFEAKDFDPNNVSVATMDEEFVAYSNVTGSPNAEDGLMFTGFTGVVLEHRGHGLAYAVKVRGVKQCLAKGAKRLKTENDTRNEPMLAVNRKLGFKEQQGEVVLVKDLEEASA